MITHEPCKSRGDCYHARYGRIGGRIGNREGKARGGRIGGRIQGRKNVESGVAARALKKAWAVCDANPEIRRENGRNQLREVRVRGARIGGRVAVESGQLARAAKGVPSTADGILFRSQTEASFYCIAQEFGGEPRAYPPRIDLPDGRSYFPDFILGRSILDIPANVPIELKPARNATFYQKNLPKAIEAGAFVVYWDELVE